MTDTTDRDATRDAWEDAVAAGDHERAAEIAREYTKRLAREYIKRNRQSSY